MDLLCIGNALVDVFAQADEKLADVFGITRPVQHVEIEKLIGIIDAIEQSTMLPKPVIVSGGGAANVAKIAGHLGARACFVGALGAGQQPAQYDGFGSIFAKDLADAGVKMKLLARPSPTGICLVLKTENGETRIAASPSAALEISVSDINSEDIKKAVVVVIDGYMLNRHGIVQDILRLTKELNATVALDISSVSIAKEHAEEIKNFALDNKLILFMNEEETSAFIKAGAFNENQGSLRLLTAGRPFPIIVVKLGGRGALVFANGEIHQAKTHVITPVETTGAGDAFCAGFLSAWVKGEALSECAAKGNKAACLVLGAEGTGIA